MTHDPGTQVDTTELSLIIRAKAGGREEFGELVRRYLARVYRSAYAILRNADDADDVTQETFVRAYQGISRFDEQRPLFPWLYRIARNLSLNRIQRGYNREAVLPEPDYISDRSPGPDQALVHAGEIDSVRAAVQRLPARFREIIELSHFQDCTYQEIADMLDIPIGTVMSRLFNARQKLKTFLDDTGSGL